MTKSADQFLAVRIDRMTSGYHVVAITVHFSDTAIERKDGRPGMVWGFAPIEYRSQSDRENERNVCYGHDEPTVGHHTRLSEAENAIRKAKQLQRATDKLDAEFGPARTPGDVLRRIAKAAKVKVAVFDGVSTPIAEVARKADESTALFLGRSLETGLSTNG